MSLRDEATGEWKFLNERERTIEQAIQEMVRPGGLAEHQPRGRAADVAADVQGRLVTRKKLGNFAVMYGATKVPVRLRCPSRWRGRGDGA